MAKRRTGKSVAKRVEEGYGEGRGDAYKPAIWTRDFSSKGLSTEGKGWKTNREHQFLSLNELLFFYVLEWSQVVADIREQFPLDIEETLEISRLCGIEHPAEGTGNPVVMITDFVVTLKKETELEDQVRTVKTSQDLQKTRVLEKLEIERRYWESRGISWGIVTEREIPKVLAENVRDIHAFFRAEKLYPLSETMIQQISCVLAKEISMNEKSIRDIAASCDKHLCLDTGDSLAVTRHLIATRKWLVDMHQPLQPQIRDKMSFLAFPSTDVA